MPIIKSWTGVFKQSAQVIDVHTYPQLLTALEFPSKVIGSLHSYNDSALYHRVIRLGDEWKTIALLGDDRVHVGAATQIKDLMNFLLENDLRLTNSGNFREQTVAGALIGGTHGFGKSATMADMVEEFTGLFEVGGELVIKQGSASDLRHPALRCVTSLILKVESLQSFRVDNCVCRLSELEPHSTDTARAYAVLPYSDKEDPVCTIAEYSKNHTHVPSKRFVSKRALPWKWWRLKVWWCIDAAFPPLRRWVQRALSFIKMKPFTLYTDKRDIDALYDPYPGPDGRTLRFSRWAYRPTYTCYNISLFVLPEDVKDVIRFAIRDSEVLHKTLLRCFIGVRELSDKSEVTFAGNYEGPVSAIDLYCSPKNADALIALQKRIQEKFWTRPHWGKTV